MKVGALREEVQAVPGILQPLRISQSQTNRNPHIRKSHLSDHRSIRKFHHGMNDTLRVHVHSDFGRRHIEEPASLDDFQTLVHHGGGIDGNLPAHGPLWMIQRLIQSHIFQLFRRVLPERSPGCGQKNPPNFPSLVSFQTLENGAVLAVYRQELHALSRHGIHHQRASGHQGFLIGQRNILPQPDSVIGRRQTADSHQGIHNHVSLDFRQLNQTFIAIVHGKIRESFLHPTSIRFVSHADPMRPIFLNLLNQFIHPASAAQSGHGKQIRILIHNVQGLRTDGAGASQNNYFLHPINLLSSSSLFRLYQNKQNVVAHCRCHENHTVKTVHNAAVTRDQVSVILNSHSTLEHGCG